MTIRNGDMPAINSVWQHRNGNTYQVLLIANEGTIDFKKYPVAIVYQNTKNKTIWVRPAHDWHRSMTEIANAATDGITKREQFAMAAMQGFCSDGCTDLKGIPKAAVDMADAILAELDKDVDETKIDASQKPLPELEVDAKVLVWDDSNYSIKRHFSHFSGGRIYTFDAGATSFTKLHEKSVTSWDFWELAK